MPSTSLSFSLGATIALLALLVGCAGRERCAETAACAAGTVCQPDGTCRPFADDLSTRFSRGVIVEAQRTSLSHADANDDTLPLGGVHGTKILLEFDALPESLVTAAELILEPQSEWNGATTQADVVVSRVRDGSSSAATTELIRDHIGGQIVAAGIARPLRIDIRDALRDVQRAGARHISLLVRVDGSSEALLYARSPRPRLWLLVP